MTQESNKISVYRALTERKSLEDRINKALVQPFITYAQGKGDRQSIPLLPGKSEADVKSLLKANFDSVQGLIERRNAITSAIILSNAATKVTIAGVEMTVAEAIERKKSIVLERSLVTSVVTQRNQVLAKITLADRGIETRIETQVSNLITGKDKKSINPEDMVNIRISVENYEKVIPVEPLDMLAWSAAKLEEIGKFESEVDVILTESNSKTEIDLTPKAAPVVTAAPEAVA